MTQRLYYDDSFLRTFTAQVEDIRESSRVDGVSVWQIVLDRTAFYPTSGGQPYDTGSLTATSRNGAILEVPIESVEEDEQGQIWHFTRKPLLAGTAVQAEIDWPRRLDHLQQHSGQHLLSAVFARELNAPTVSFHLGESSSTIDLTTATLAHHSLERVERIANEIIAEDRPVTIRTIPRSEADALLAAGKLRKLPERDGDIRLIDIADYDLNACGGTHVRSTGQIGGLLLRSTEKISRGVRVEFVCGLRAVTHARHDFDLIGRASAALSVGRDDIPAAVERFQAEVKSGVKERQKLREELATYHAVRLAVEELSEENLRLVHRLFPDRDRDYIRLLASRLGASVPRTIAVFVSTESDPAHLVLGRSHDLELHCGQFLREALTAYGFRGGGSADLAQGEIPQSRAQEISAKIASAIRDAIPR